MNPYWLIITGSGILIISYLIDILSKRTNIPSVLMLMSVGILLNLMGHYFGFRGTVDLFPILEVFGILGLIMIILEAALDLKISREKLPTIFKALGVASILLVGTSILTAYIIHYLLNISLSLSFLYAIPLSIMSSAIIIPSVEQLEEQRREFLIYEATFSDILGIMLFYFTLDTLESPDLIKAVGGVGIDFVVTVLISFLATYIIILAFQKLFTNVNYFLIFAILMLLYAIGKLLHLSSLIMILIFGIVVNNRQLFFRGFLERTIDKSTYEGILENFKLFTGQTTFVVRTFFFVIFGMTLTASSFDNLSLYAVTGVIIVSIFLVRFLSLTLFFKKKLMLKMFIAPRGLITILLFFSIPKEYLVGSFEEDIIFLAIIVTNLVMMGALIFRSKNKEDLQTETSIPNVSDE